MFAAAFGGILLALAGFSPAAWAAAGHLDLTFNSTGKVTTKIGSGLDDAYAVAIQPDGKIVVAGSSWNGSQYVFALTRYNPNGSLDNTFGSGGIVTTGGVLGYAYAMALQPDGKIVAAGYGGISTSLFALARYNTNGSLDTTFNGTGIVTTAIGSSNDQAYAVAIQPGGKIVAAGYSYNGTEDIFAVARYNANGSLDTTFNGTGFVTTQIGTVESMAQSVVVQPNGKIVAIGWGSSGPGAPFFALARYNVDGSLDASFNTTGIVTTTLGSTYNQAWAGALQTDGKIIAAGDSWIGGQGVFALARYNTNGSLDTSFNTTGIVTNVIGANDNINSVAVQPDGKIVAAGTSGATLTGNPWFFALARYNANGSLDTTFGAGGKVTTAIGSSADSIASVALQPDGKIVAAGPSNYGTQQDAFAVARYLGRPAIAMILELLLLD